MNQSLKLSDARQRTPAADALGPAAMAMRRAAMDAISLDDITAIIRKQVEKAKAGDQAAAKFVLDYATGGAPKVQVNVGVRGESKPRESGPPPIVLNGNGRHDPDLDDAMESEQPTVGELRRRIARYLAKNGATPWPDLAELFRCEIDDEATILASHEWFEKATAGWHITKQGRKENA